MIVTVQTEIDAKLSESSEEEKLYPVRRKKNIEETVTLNGP